MLLGDPVSLLLHSSVEQQHAEHSDGEHNDKAGGERRLATAWCRRTRGHQCRR
jgi:hypothetical protein